MPFDIDKTVPCCTCIKVQPYILFNISCMIVTSLTLAVILDGSLCSTKFQGSVHILREIINEYKEKCLYRIKKFIENRFFKRSLDKFYRENVGGNITESYNGIRRWRTDYGQNLSFCDLNDVFHSIVYETTEIPFDFCRRSAQSNYISIDSRKTRSI